MAVVNLSTAFKLARLNGANSLNGLLGATGFAMLYTGTPPVNPDTTATGTFLGSLALSATAGVVTTVSTNGVWTANTVTNGVGAASGTVGYVRLAANSTANGVGIIDCDAGITGSGATAIFNTTTISVSLVLACSSIVFTSN